MPLRSFALKLWISEHPKRFITVLYWSQRQWDRTRFLSLFNVKNYFTYLANSFNIFTILISIDFPVKVHLEFQTSMPKVLLRPAVFNVDGKDTYSLFTHMRSELKIQLFVYTNTKQKKLKWTFVVCMTWVTSIGRPNNNLPGNKNKNIHSPGKSE